MKSFMDEEFLLFSDTARVLYHGYAESLPIIDFHSHLSPADIANDRKFRNLTQAWLAGDHYKWRAMRANGIAEKFITGNAADPEKFNRWAETVPYTLRNPLYHWTHLELKRYFGISDRLNATSAGRIYNEAETKLQSDAFSCRNLLKMMKVEIVCTTDDPVDSLDYHRALNEVDPDIRVLPTFRADNAMAVRDPESYNRYLNRLEEISGTSIETFSGLLTALKKRHEHFTRRGCRLSDHGLYNFYADEYSESEIEKLFKLIRSGAFLNYSDQRKIMSAILYELAVMDHDAGWVQQFHYGALRNTNSRMLSELGPDTGFDSIGSPPALQPMADFLDRLSRDNKLTKTIVYNLNPADNEMVATMMGNFQDGSIPGKMQFGPAWWFHDQKDGMEKQLNVLSNMGLLSRFVGMLTDSRSFLSFPRHEYFRRILCNLLGSDIENGLMPNDTELIGKMVRDICYNNAKTYFEF